MSFDPDVEDTTTEGKTAPAIICGPPEFRGIFGEKGDSANWLDTCSRFPNGVPRFESKEECMKFMVDYNTYNGGSNPDYPHLQHIFTTLISWEQIENILLPAIYKARKEPTHSPYNTKEGKEKLRNYGDPEKDKETFKEDNSNANVYEQADAKEVFDAIDFRLNVPFHKCTTPTSTMNTLKYLFYHMKCGIFVMIRNGKIRIFAPFTNSEYRNVWSEHLKIEGTGELEPYYREKANFYRPENVETDKSKWWANGNIICNELVQNEKERKNMQHWGDQFLSPLRDMLAEACNQRSIPDCEFFLNKRDYPQLKVNIPRGIPVEPYGFIYDKDDRDPNQDVDLCEEHKFKTYAPIVSFYAAAEDRFTDVPWPSSEDWEGACGLVFPQTFMHKKNRQGIAEISSNPRDLFTEANFRKFERGWDENRIRTAFFRGGATGGGTTIHNNQRLMCAHLGHLWKDDPERGGGTDEPFLDAAIVGWNLRDKKVAESPMTFLRQKNFDFTAGRHHFIPIYEQSKYKYLVYIDGHCAACRYAFMMRLGSVILKVEARQVADRMWFFPLLKPFVDHVPVKSDLSDLEEKIRWCRENDDKCRQIAINCQQLYDKYVSRNGLLDYLEMATKCMAKRYIEPPTWFDPPPRYEDPPKLNKPDVPCYEDRATRQGRLCKKCQEEKDELIRKEKEQMKLQSKEKKLKKQSKQTLRERMKKRAKKLAEQQKKS